LDEKNQTYNAQINYANEISNLRNQLLEKESKLTEIQLVNSKINEASTKANLEFINRINSLNASLDDAKKAIEELSSKYQGSLANITELQSNLSKQTSECDKLINCIKLAASEKEALQNKLKATVTDYELLKIKSKELQLINDCESKSINENINLDHESKSITLDPPYPKYRINSAAPKRGSPNMPHQKTNFTVKGATLTLQKSPQYNIHIRKSKHILNNSAANTLHPTNSKYAYKQIKAARIK
jgi:chromosome segregation ATPase